MHKTVLPFPAPQLARNALPQTSSLIEVRHLQFQAGGRTLIDIEHLAIHPGRRTVIMGANGAGKSLLLRLMHGLLRPSSGQIFWQGKALDKVARSAQAMVFQRPVMLRRSVLANFRFALTVRGIAGAERARREKQAIQDARLEDLVHSPARVLSGGEQQRLAIARALSCQPDMLFLDEPTAALDPASTAAIEEQIELASQRGISIVMVTHDRGQAFRLAQNIVFMHGGQIAESGDASMLLNHPRSEPARAWLEGRIYLDPQHN